MIKEKVRKDKQYWIDGEVNKIENYDLAIADTTQVWHCHHKLEIQGDKVISKNDLIKQGLYYHRPAEELIFLTRSEHMILHGKHPRIRKVGELNSFYGKHHSEETKKRISKSRKGKCVGKDNFNYGKAKSEEVRKKISQSKKGHIPWNKGLKLVNRKRP